MEMLNEHSATWDRTNPKGLFSSFIILFPSGAGKLIFKIYCLETMNTPVAPKPEGRVEWFVPKLMSFVAVLHHAPA